MSPHQRYEQSWRELLLCDELGFDYSFCVEHHFHPDESWMSSASLYAVGAGTRRIRIGPMGYVVPLYHPRCLAAGVALVDQMLGEQIFWMIVSICGDETLCKITMNETNIRGILREIDAAYYGRGI